MTEPDLARLGQLVAEREDARLDAVDTGTRGELTRRFLAEHAARRVAPERAARHDGPRLERPRARRWLRLSLAALVAVAASFVLKDALFLPPPPLSFTIGAAGERGALRDWESAPDDAPLPIRFSDGTLVELEPRARARVLAVGHAGAEIVIESGRAHLAVVPARAPVSGEAPWRVSLGPFSVEVKGTRFDVEWDPRTDDFALDLFEGSVRVSGCEEGHSHTLVAGQGVRASCSKKQWALVAASEAARTEAAPAVPTAPDNVPPAAPAAPAPSMAAPRAADAPGASPATAARAASRSWQALALQGHYAAAYERALELGFESECERAGATDLARLGDSARLANDAARARAAYLAVRRRFGGTGAAAQAAFALGRLAVKSDPGAATEWFERYLSEAPRGSLEPAARDWLFELAVESGDPTRRHEVARRYLDHHPDGAHAEDARRLLDASPSR